MRKSFRVVSDNYSNHNLPIGALVERLVEHDDVTLYTQGGVGDEVAIDERDLVVVQWWHCFGGVNDVGDMAGLWMQVMAGPTDESADGTNRKGVPIQEIFRESNPYLKYLGSFDHEPSELEKDRLAPDDYRVYDDDGGLIDWENA